MCEGQAGCPLKWDSSIGESTFHQGERVRAVTVLILIHAPYGHDLMQDLLTVASAVSACVSLPAQIKLNELVRVSVSTRRSCEARRSTQRAMR